MWSRVPLLASLLAGCVALSVGACAPAPERALLAGDYSSEDLRVAYAGKPETWPAPTITGSEKPFSEMGQGARPVRQVSDPELVSLGQALFFSPVLSGSEDLSCATCHDPGRAFSREDRQAVGHNGMMGTRNAPGLLGVKDTAPYFWDGRAASLEAQAVEPILNPIEMAGVRESVESRLNAREEWRDLFQLAGEEGPIVLEDVGRALAAYERTLTSESAFDRFLAGDQSALTDEQLKGLHLFRTKARCMTCHNGAALSDGEFHNIGLVYYGRKYEDLGRYAETQKAEDVGKFNTPSLRNVSRTAPYMHNGLLPSLRGVVNYYNGGGARPARKDDQMDDPLFPSTSDRLVPLDLTPEERDALVAFLETL